MRCSLAMSSFENSLCDNALTVASAPSEVKQRGSDGARAGLRTARRGRRKLDRSGGGGSGLAPPAHARKRERRRAPLTRQSISSGRPAFVPAAAGGGVAG